jgi:hypothetical protein
MTGTYTWRWASCVCPVCKCGTRHIDLVPANKPEPANGLFRAECDAHLRERIGEERWPRYLAWKEEAKKHAMPLDYKPEPLAQPALPFGDVPTDVLTRPVGEVGPFEQYAAKLMKLPGPPPRPRKPRRGDRRG